MCENKKRLIEAAEKSSLRRAGRDVRAALSHQQRGVKSQQICARLQQLWDSLMRAHPRYERLATAVYLANETEASVDEFARITLARGLVVVAPRMNVEPAFYMLESTLVNVKVLPIGDRQNWLRQPHCFEGGRAFEPSEIGGFIVPGAAFDAQGNRIGQGGGWYDRVLGKAPHAVVIGVCFDCQMFGVVPQQSHDCRVHYVVTESQTIVTGVPISP